MNMKYLLLRRKATGHIPSIHPFVNIGFQVLLVEAHGRDYGACGPVYHDVCQKVIQGKFPGKKGSLVSELMHLEKKKKSLK